MTDYEAFAEPQRSKIPITKAPPYKSHHSGNLA